MKQNSYPQICYIALLGSRDNTMFTNVPPMSVVSPKKSWSFQNHSVFPLFSRNEKSATWISSKSLIFSVDQPGLEPGTSRLWVSQSDILWDSVVCNHYWLSMLYKIIIFFESQKISLTEIVCLRRIAGKKCIRQFVCQVIIRDFYHIVFFGSIAKRIDCSIPYYSLVYNSRA